MELKAALGLAVIALVVVIAAVRVLATPVKLLLRVGCNTLLGLGALILLNATSALTGLSLGLNLFNAAVVGILGIPGLVLLLLARWVLV